MKRSTFTRRHYRVLAHVLALSRGASAPEGQYERGWLDGIDNATLALAAVLATDSPHFCRDTFLRVARDNAAALRKEQDND